jgi:hypothetical protein
VSQQYLEGTLYVWVLTLMPCSSHRGAANRRTATRECDSLRGRARSATRHARCAARTEPVTEATPRVLTESSFEPGPIRPWRARAGGGRSVSPQSVRPRTSYR